MHLGAWRKKPRLLKEDNMMIIVYAAAIVIALAWLKVRRKRKGREIGAVGARG